MKMNSKLGVVIFSIFAVSCISCSSRFTEPLAGIPQPLRERFTVRLKALVANMRSEQYDRVYDLFSDSYLNHLKAFHRSNKVEYVTATKELPKSIPAFDDFVPTSSTKTADDVWIISGTIISRYNNQKFESKSAIEARWEKGDWYFSEFSYERE